MISIVDINNFELSICHEIKNYTTDVFWKSHTLSFSEEGRLILVDGPSLTLEKITAIAATTLNTAPLKQRKELCEILSLDDFPMTLTVLSSEGDSCLGSTVNCSWNLLKNSDFFRPSIEGNYRETSETSLRLTLPEGTTRETLSHYLSKTIPSDFEGIMSLAMLYNMLGDPSLEKDLLSALQDELKSMEETPFPLLIWCQTYGYAHWIPEIVKTGGDDINQLIGKIRSLTDLDLSDKAALVGQLLPLWLEEMEAAELLAAVISLGSLLEKTPVILSLENKAFNDDQLQILSIHLPVVKTLELFSNRKLTTLPKIWESSLKQLTLFECCRFKAIPADLSKLTKLILYRLPSLITTLTTTMSNLATYEVSNCPGVIVL